MSIAMWGETGERASTEEEWIQAGFGNPDIVSIDTGKFYRHQHVDFTHSFDLVAVIFRKTGWTKSAVLRRIKKAAEIYGRYGIKIQRLTLIIAKSPTGIIDFWQPGGEDVDISIKTPETGRPIIYYIRAVPRLNAYSWIRTGRDRAIPPPLQDTVWISLAADMPLNLKRYRSDYITEAHELGHIFLNSQDHTAPGMLNLMSDSPDTADRSLTLKQVSLMQQHPSMRKITE